MAPRGAEGEGPHLRLRRGAGRAGGSRERERGADPARSSPRAGGAWERAEGAVGAAVLTKKLRANLRLRSPPRACSRRLRMAPCSGVPAELLE